MPTAMNGRVAAPDHGNAEELTTQPKRRGRIVAKLDTPDSPVVPKRPGPATLA